MRLVVTCYLIGGLASFVVLRSAGAATPPPIGSTTITGTLTTIYGDAPPGANGAVNTLFFITDDQGTQTQLDISEAVLRAAGGALALDRQRVTVTVTAAPSAVAPNGSAPVKSVQDIRLADAAQSGSAPTATPAAPADIYVTGTTSATVSFAWTPQDPAAGIVVSNGVAVIDLGVAGSSYTETGMAAGSWVCISLAAYNASGTSPWTPWVCGQAT